MRRRNILKSAASAAALGGTGLGRPAIARVPANTLRFVPYVISYRSSLAILQLAQRWAY